jgi:penicillin-binding protein 1A
MGRDDAKRVAGLAGGSAPARAFHDFMSVAVANRPVEQFETQVPLPDWQLTPEEEVYGDQVIDINEVGPMVDENGMPILNPPPFDQNYPQQQPMVQPDGSGAPTQQELDRAFPPQQPGVRRAPPYPPQPQPRPPQPRQQPYPMQPQPQQQPPRSTPPADPSEPRPYPA